MNVNRVVVLLLVALLAILFLAYSFAEEKFKKAKEDLFLDEEDRGTKLEEQLAKERERHTHTVVREVKGKKVGIEVDNDPYGDFMADVIARTLETGKPQAGTYDNGDVTIESVEFDEEDHG